MDCAVYGQGVTTDAGLSFTFEDWNLFDDSDAWREATLGTVAERKEKLVDPAPARRAEKPDAARKPDQLLRPDHHHRLRAPENKHLEGLTMGDAAKRTGKHMVDTMLDLAVSEDLKTEFFAPGSTATWS